MAVHSYITATAGQRDGSVVREPIDGGGYTAGVDVAMTTLPVNTPVAMASRADLGTRTSGSVTVYADDITAQVALDPNGPWASSVNIGQLSDINTRWYFRQTALKGIGAGQDIAAFKVAHTGLEDIPDAPVFISGPTVSNITAISASVGWAVSDPDGGSLAVKVIVKAENVAPTTQEWASAVQQPSSPMSVTGLAGSTPYWVFGLVSDGTLSSLSTVATFTTTAPSSNQAPQFTTAPRVKAGTVTAAGYTLEWAMTDSEGDAITVKRSTDGGAYATITPAGPTSGLYSYEVTGVASGTAFAETLRLEDATHTGAQGTTASPVTATTLPAQVGTLTLTTPASGEVGVSFAAITGATGYHVEKSTDGNSWTNVTRSDYTALTETITGLTIGTLYSFRAHAYNASGDGAYSAVGTKTPVDLTAPGNVTDFTCTPGDTQNVLNWTLPSDNVGTATIRIEWGTTTSYGNTIDLSAVSTHTHTGRTNGTLLYYRIKALDAAGNESVSYATAQGTPAAAELVAQFSAWVENSNTVWATCRDAASGNYVSVTGSYSSAVSGTYYSGDGKMYVDRSFVQFTGDFTGLTKLRLHATAANGDSAEKATACAGSSTIVICQGSQTHGAGGVLTTAAFNDFLTTELGRGDFNADGSIEIALNAAGLAYLAAQSGGTAKFCLRNIKDFDNVSPGASVNNATFGSYVDGTASLRPTLIS